MRILVTGGAGYIGSHTTLTLLQAGYDVLVLDNLSNGSIQSLERVKKLAGREPVFVKGDIRNRAMLEQLFVKYSIDAVFHFAGLKAIGESIFQPLRYYDNNVQGSQVLFQVMADAAVFKLVFSSSASVYGELAQGFISEACSVCLPTNPYSRSKLMVENILQDLAVSDPSWSIALLRYFNPVGAHDSGLIGEDAQGIPNNLLPYISQVAMGRLSKLTVFGNDYPTPDGTGVRDYIHVIDLAEGHLLALEALQSRNGAHIWNLGTGRGHSVLEMIHAFEEISGKSVPYCIAPRRPGDVAICCADPTKAEYELGWKAKRDLSLMLLDAWRWQLINPNGYS